MIRVVRVAAAMLLGVLAVLAAPATPASAHAVLVRTSPVAGSVVPAAPSAVVLTFSESVRPVADQTRILGPDNQRAEQGAPAARGGEVTITLRPSPPQGTYVVRYRVISTDGHPIAGGFSFSIGVASRAEPAASGGVYADVDTVVAVLLPVVRYLGYAGLALLVGSVLVLATLWPARLSRRSPLRLMWVGIGLIGASTVGALLLQAPYTTGSGLFEVSGSELRDVFGSRFGAAHLIRIAVLIVAVPLLRVVTRAAGMARDGPTDRVLLALLAIVGLATWPVAGHPGASSWPRLAIVADAVHLAAMSVWLGGLVMLVRYLLPRGRDEELGALLPVWSRWASWAVGALVAAGLTQGVIEVGTPKALVTTRYGWLLIAKVGVFVVLLTVAALSRRRVRRGGRLYRLVAVEVAIAAAILGVTAVLVQTTPARNAEAGTVGSTDLPYTTTLTSEFYKLQVDVAPARRGTNSVHLTAFTNGGEPLPIRAWKATVARPAEGAAPIDIALLELTPNHVTGQVQLPEAGRWDFRFTLDVSETERASVSVTVAIR